MFQITFQLPSNYRSIKAAFFQPTHTPFNQPILNRPSQVGCIYNHADTWRKQSFAVLDNSPQKVQREGNHSAAILHYSIQISSRSSLLTIKAWRKLQDFSDIRNPQRKPATPSETRRLSTNSSSSDAAAMHARQQLNESHALA